MIAAATVTGAWLGRRHPRQRETWSGAAAGAWLIMPGYHLLPDAWSAVRAAGMWHGTAAIAAAASFVLAGAC